MVFPRADVPCSHGNTMTPPPPSGWGREVLANGYFANGYFENPRKGPGRPAVRERKGGKRLNPFG